MNIDWNELPKGVACIVAHSDFSGLFNCYIDESGQLLTVFGSDEVDLSSEVLVAVNPNVSPGAFARAVLSSSAKEICRLKSQLKKIN